MEPDDQRDDASDAGTDDDVLEIAFDDDEDAAPPPAATSSQVIEISFDDEDSQPASPPPPRRRSHEPEPDDAEDTDIGAKVCPACGFAIPPLTSECPRCARFGAPRAGTAPENSDGPLPPVDDRVYPAATPRRSRIGVVIGAIVGILLVVGAAALTAYLILNSPTQRARRAYEEGVRAQLSGDMETARAKYLEALELDPDMGLAAYSMGTTYLGISLSGGTQAYLQQLVQMAAAGDTRMLEEADRWFDHTIVITNRLPEGTSLQHETMGTPAQLASYAHTMKAITAYIRYAAGLMSEDPLSGAQWLGVMQSELQQAFALDPTNPQARDIENQVPPL